MPLVKSIASSLAGRSVGKQLGRRIPNPILRFAVVTAATTLGPMIVRRVQAAMKRRQLKKASSLSLKP